MKVRIYTDSQANKIEEMLTSLGVSYKKIKDGFTSRYTTVNLPDEEAVIVKELIGENSYSWPVLMQ